MFVEDKFLLYSAFTALSACFACDKVLRFSYQVGFYHVVSYQVLLQNEYT
jgi:hypothetical protein